METIFDKETRTQLIGRIEKINPNHEPAWGKMNVFQMLEHNTYWNGWMLGKGNHSYKQTLLGKIFGRIALRKMIKDQKPFDRNIPTSDQFIAQNQSGDVEAEKAKWISLLADYENFHNPTFVHDFFGRMTKEQVGVLVYKHTDHHLRQFGA